LAIEQLLDLPAGGLVHSWNSLKANGNMSSVSVLDIFNRTLHEAKNKKPLKNDFLLSLAMGPGFSAEIGLFQWN
jgi:alkylresorcinol/alkylpyrone synthase